MASPNLYLFGDQTYDVQSSLKDLIRHKNNPVLDEFLAKSYEAVRHEIYGLPAETRESLPRFTAVDDILLRKPGGTPCVPLDMAVTCMYQLGTFISQADPRYHCGDNARTLGICTGALAAAAVSCSQSTLDLVPLGVTAVKVAFRTGMHVTDVAQRVAPVDSVSRNWSMIVAGLESTQAAVEEFCGQTILPPTSKPYISAYAPNGATVSGPPRSLDQLSASPSFSNLKFQKIQINAPYHAPHLYSQQDVKEVIGDLIPENLRSYPSEIRRFSSTDATTEASRFETCLEDAVEQILLRPIRWATILEELQADLEKLRPQNFTVTPIGTKADQVIHTALKQTSLSGLLAPTPTPTHASLSDNSTSSRYGKSKLAIVGMSGRYPGAKNNEAFWDVL
ncbi:MAG: hypothetical protein L6R41_007007, partial [Letrouitia leprolyta]